MGDWMDHWDEPDEFDDYSNDGYSRGPRKIYPAFVLKGRWTGVSTAKAILWRFLNGTEEWFPRHHVSGWEKGNGSMTVSGWLANQKRLTKEHNIEPIGDGPPPMTSQEDYGFEGYDPE